MRVILASGSPRRVDLLSQLVAHFEVIPSHVNEEALTTADPLETAERLARAKAEAVSASHPGATVIGADTVVALGSRQLAKPMDAADARAMLCELSGRTHRVITGVCVCCGGESTVFSETTTVTFRELSEEEVAAYVATGEPMDKAGAYAIQGGAAAFVTQTEGSLTNVVGLPMERLTAVWQRLSLPQR